jgi:hypothetical protein
VRRALMLARALVAGLVLCLAGCARLAAVADPDASPSPPSYDWPAAAAGAACGLLDFGTVAQELGTTFDTAGGAQVDNTYTCAVTRAGQQFPDLSLSLSGTDVDDLIFTISVAPDGSTPVKRLGRAAYLLPVAASAGHGPGIEYGWLSSKPRLVVVRYTFAVGATQADVDAMAPKLLVLAERVEKSA